MVSSTAAQDDTNAPAKQPPCSGPEHRQFDFWLGEWEVTANDKVAGSSKITSILGGCVIFEEWKSASPYAGKSFNRFDPETKTWSQIWVDSTGGILKLVGEYKDGKMILQGEHINAGEAVIDRITWTNNEDGTVRQVWEKSKDNGQSWNAVFDGLYRQKKDPAKG